MINEMGEIWLLKLIKAIRISLWDERFNMTYKFFTHLHLIQVNIYILQIFLQWVFNYLMKKNLQ